MVADLTGLPLANSSLLDEATAAAEAMTMCHRISRGKRNGFFVASDCHPQTIAVIQTRAKPIGIELHIGSPDEVDFQKQDLFGVLLQYPTTDGRICDYSELTERAHQAQALVVVATDLLALTLIRPPGEFGADVAVGNSQRFGVPLGFGGPHAAFMATHDKHLRQMPGRIAGISKDAQGNPAHRLVVQTREQHIRREKATSNICTAQVLLAIMAGMYAVWHGPQGLRRIAQRVHAWTVTLAKALRDLGHNVGHDAYFDTLRVKLGSGDTAEVITRASQHKLNLRTYEDGTIGISLDERTDGDELIKILQCFGFGKPFLLGTAEQVIDKYWQLGNNPKDPEDHRTVSFYGFERESPYLTHTVFNNYHAEHEMLRYLHRLQARDLSLCTSMIPLGSCTMKLNSTTEMLPISWPEFANIHPYAPTEQTAGYAELFQSLENWLSEITGLPAVSLQPNSGAAGEHTGLLVIRAYHAANGNGHRDVCLIPISAHGTNPASSAMAGYRVVPVACDEGGNIDVTDLERKAEMHHDELAALMITYPSTHGVFEEGVREMCAVIHANGGQVYMDGANMNAQCGLCRPGDIGADVVHLNLHKTFAIPHGGGGPGVGPIACAKHLASFLPSHPLVKCGGEKAIGPIAAAPYGSPSILPISWMYIGLMGEPGLKQATQVAILNANYMAERLKDHYPVLYTGKNGCVAHEFIIDLREFQKSAHVTVDDVAKRLMDFGFHAPTMSFPVAGTLMIEPTESESKAELDRLCDALIAIRAEIREIEASRMDPENNPLKHAPHTASAVSATEWNHPYPREQAAYPAPWVRAHKFWPPVARIDNVWGDRNLFCSCSGMESFADAK